jgi:hypothetical protein
MSKAKTASFLSSYAKKGPLFCHGYCTKYHLSTLEQVHRDHVCTRAAPGRVHYFVARPVHFLCVPGYISKLHPSLLVMKHVYTIMQQYYAAGAAALCSKWVWNFSSWSENSVTNFSRASVTLGAAQEYIGFWAAKGIYTGGIILFLLSWALLIVVSHLPLAIMALII